LTYADLLAQWWGPRQTSHRMPPAKWRTRIASGVVRHGWPPMDQAGPPPTRASTPRGASARTVLAVLDAHEPVLLVLLAIADAAFGAVVTEPVASRTKERLTRSDVAEKVVSLVLRRHLPPASPWPPDVAQLDVARAGEQIAQFYRDELRGRAGPVKLSARAFADRWAEEYDGLWARWRADRSAHPAPPDLLLGWGERPPLVDAHSSPTRLAPGAPRAYGRKDWRLGLDRAVYFRYESCFDGRRLRTFSGSGSFAHEDLLRIAARVPPEADRRSVVTACMPLGVVHPDHRDILLTVHDALVSLLPERRDGPGHDPWLAWLDSAGRWGPGAPELRAPALTDQIHRWRRQRIEHGGDLEDPPDPPAVARVMRQCWFMLHRWEQGFCVTVMARYLAEYLARYLAAERHEQESPPLEAPELLPALDGGQGEVDSEVDVSDEGRSRRREHTVALLRDRFAKHEEVLLASTEDLSAPDLRRRDEVLLRYAAVCDDAARGLDMLSPWEFFVSPAQWQAELSGLQEAHRGLVARAGVSRRPSA
jgi:hypothetical protein